MDFTGTQGGRTVVRTSDIELELYRNINLTCFTSKMTFVCRDTLTKWMERKKIFSKSFVSILYI